jgi:hypothetical protein
LLPKTKTIGLFALKDKVFYGLRVDKNNHRDTIMIGILDGIVSYQQKYIQNFTS